MPGREDFNPLISRGSSLWSKKDRSKMERNFAPWPKLFNQQATSIKLQVFGQGDEGFFSE